jgi:SAM-dependent methyltransferase
MTSRRLTASPTVQRYGPQRAAVDRALRQARVSAYGPGEFIGQEGFMRASEILSLAKRAGVAPGVSVLDVCCGVAGPGRFITRELGCIYTGVDASAEAVEIARERAGDLACRFEISRVPPLPPGPFDVVMLLETMLAFPDKEPLLREIGRALPGGGRFVFTLEEGRPLTRAERERMPAADTVWLVPLDQMLTCLGRAGLRVRLQEQCSQAHRATVDCLVEELAARESAIAEHLGRRAVDDLLAAHRLWSEWLRDGRVRKFAFVAEKA